MGTTTPPHSSPFAVRLATWGPDIRAGIASLYPDHIDETYARIISLAQDTFNDRSHVLKKRDEDRDPLWFQSEKAIGYVAYTDRFAGDLKGVQEKIPYLASLGVTYLHLMPLLKPRPGENDGGYAVMDYRSIKTELGSIEDLASLCEKLHENDITLTIDLVLNHVAAEHEWAVRAKNGEDTYRDYFYIFPDREIPDQFEMSLPEVFPDFAPGNFTWDDDLKGWVWTTFNSYQWDVNWSNPALLLEYLDIVGFLANLGVDCLRLDAIAFMWKRLGTNSQNQEEVHSITQVLRAFTRIVAPSVIFQAEAIVGPNDVGAYLGAGKFTGKVSDVAYHNSLMVQIWSAFAARDARLMETALNRFQELPPTTAWTTYLRCHDDIGWAIDDSDAQALGWSGSGHRGFLSDFYSGAFPGSFAKGEVFQSNPLTGDKRISGSAASLAGIEVALGSESGEIDSAALAHGIDRVLLGYAMVFGFGGLPLLYMGDELGLLNDYSYVERSAETADNRWVHRPFFPDLSRSNPTMQAIAGVLTERLERLAKTRAQLPQLHATQTSRVQASSAKSVVFITREGERGSLLEVYNVSEDSMVISSDELPFAVTPVDLISGAEIVMGEQVHIPGLAAWWLLPR